MTEVANKTVNTAYECPQKVNAETVLAQMRVNLSNIEKKLNFLNSE